MLYQPLYLTKSKLYYKKLSQQGTILAVATGKARAGLNRVLAATGFADYFVDSICADEANSKPHPQMIELLIERLGIEPDSAVMIGDSALDMAMAQNAGVAAIGVTYGAHSRDTLAKHAPVAIIDQPAELLLHI